jgi:hypothetical protein
VELSFIAYIINNVTPGICNVFADDLDKFNRFFQIINGGENLVLVEADINVAKGRLLHYKEPYPLSSVKTAVRQFS